jgi:non-heme chloroperoxidase
MEIHTVNGAADVKLHVREYGKSSGIPILLIHGWSQSYLCWAKQFGGALKDEARIVALDLRGHGMSDAPAEADQYTDGDKWADDIAAVIDQLALDRPILVGWSYAGYIISDYVRRKGQGKIAGINFVDAAVVLDPTAFGSLVGPGFLENAPGACQDDLPTNIAAIRRFLRLHRQANLAGRFRGNSGLQHGCETECAARFTATRTRFRTNPRRNHGARPC